MVRNAIQTNYYGMKSEEGQNPYTGFVSYQHFRNDRLYSDIVVRPENNMTETENVEGYPVPDHVPQNGWGEGFYPDTTVAYIRILWKEFEPEQGEYNYAFIEDILSKAKKCGQTVMLRLMAHSTRASDDVPEWLKALIPCPQRPEGMRVKESPTDPLFLVLFGKAIQKLGERFDDDPTLDVVDISLPGAWGEGYNLELYPGESLKELIDIYTTVFKKTHLIGQCSAPELVNYANETKPVGWRGDGFGNGYHIHEFYPNAEREMSELWKNAPVSFESYWWLGEWKRRGWDLDEIIELSLKWHISTFNAKSLPIPEEWQEKIKYWIGRMGYHFSVDYFKYPDRASASDVLEFEMCIINSGVAPIYNYIPFRLKVSGEDKVHVFDTSIDIRKWLPGKVNEEFSITLPDDILVGEYDIEVGICGDDTPMVYLCTDAVRNGKFYKIGKLEII